MNRPIKFRGYDTDFPMAGMVTFTLDDLLAESESYGLVHPDSIAQLVGYDKDGREVYEDDTVYLGGKEYEFQVTISTSRNIVAKSTLKEDTK